ncbi:hypothetical protein H920_10643 [Fukomys damarensis]|uniref:Uncharacterized protein n=1 Tax=Fukomys damarensis TaxID=885580 RepID=A0A091DA51_FUKDA|nr:hypothetical protein H920_10643 [Fukomys damarensis]
MLSAAAWMEQEMTDYSILQIKIMRVCRTCFIQLGAVLGVTIQKRTLPWLPDPSSSSEGHRALLLRTQPSGPSEQPCNCCPGAGESSQQRITVLSPGHRSAKPILLPGSCSRADFRPSRLPGSRGSPHTAGFPGRGGKGLGLFSLT